MTAASFDAKSKGTIGNTTSVTVAHTIAAGGTALFVLVPYWSQDAANGVLTGVTWNAVGMTKISESGLSNSRDNVEIYFMAGPTTGTHNIIASFNGTPGNQGEVYGVSWIGTPTSGGTGVVWADFTSTKTSVNGANSTITVPNNTANDGIIDACVDGSSATPAMTAQTNRTLGSTDNVSNGEGSGWSYLAPGPVGNQVMNWTFASTSSAQAGVRVLGTAAEPFPAGYYRPKQDASTLIRM